MGRENRMVVARGLREGGIRGCCLMGIKFQLYKMNKF